MNSNKQTWFTSDLHFGHKNIMKFCPTYRTPPHCHDVDSMDDMLIDIWNNSVKPNDVVYDLGDLFFYKIQDQKDKIKSILKRLNGEHHLIVGNHDTHLLKIRDELLHNGLLASVTLYHEIRLKNGSKAILFHYPIYEWNGGYRGSIMLHGHIHERNVNEHIKGKILNVGFDNHGFMLSEDMVIDLTKDMPCISFE